MASYGDAMCSWRKRVAPSVGATVFEIPDCRRSIWRDVRPISHGLLAVSRHYGLFGHVIVAYGAGIQGALNPIVCFCLP